MAVVCNRGVTAQSVAPELRALGIDAVVLEGGMRGWIATLAAHPVDLGIEGLEVRQVQRPGRGCLSYMLAAVRAGARRRSGPGRRLLRRARRAARRARHRRRRHAPARRPPVGRPRARRCDRRGAATARRRARCAASPTPTACTAARRRRDRARRRGGPRDRAARPHVGHDRTARRGHGARRRRLAVRGRHRATGPAARRSRRRPRDGAHAARDVARHASSPSATTSCCCPATRTRASTPRRSRRASRTSRGAVAELAIADPDEFARDAAVRHAAAAGELRDDHRGQLGDLPFDEDLESGGNSCSSR